MLHPGMVFYKFLHLVNSWFLYIEPTTIAHDVKKINVILFLSLLSLTLLSLLTLSSLFPFLSLGGFGGTGRRFWWLRFESVAKF